VPIANNVVCIAVLLWFAHLTHTPSLAGVRAHPSWIVLLGLGTTLGVAVQAGLLVLTARHVGFPGLRWRWNPRHEAVRTVVRLGGWTFGFVVANQIALFVVLALAVGVPGPDPVSSYTYAYTFMQMPYAVVAVSVMSAVTPGLSERWATGDVDGFRHRFSGGLRAVLTIILPAAMGLFILAKPVVDLLFAHGSYSVAAASTTGSTLAMFSLGLPGFCTFLYCVRAFQSMQRTRVAFWLYVLENGVNVVLAVALVHPLGVRGLALSLSIAYTIAAVAALAVLRGWLGRLGDTRTWAPLRRSVAATVVMGVVVLVVSNLSGADQGFALLGRVVASVAVGAVVFVAVSVGLGRRAERTGRAVPVERRLVARAGPARADLRRSSLGTEGGVAYESGMGPGTGMVPPVGQLATARRPWSGSGLGPIYPAGSPPTPAPPAGPPAGSLPYDAERPAGPAHPDPTGDPDHNGQEG
jgi:putative peptidoglycan lipid II flippase